MHSSRLETAFALILAVAAAARADIPPDDDEHKIPYTFGVSNADADPARIVIACEFYPGSGAPVVAYRLRNETRSGLLYYKFDRVYLYRAQASDWESLRTRYAVHDGPPTGAVEKAPGDGWQAQAGTGGDWKVGDALLSRIQGEVEAGGAIVKKTDPLASVEWIYTLIGMDKQSSVALTEQISRYSDGRKPVSKEYPLGTTGIDDLSGPKARAFASLSPDRRELRLTTSHGGVAAIVLYGAGGKRMWSARRVMAPGQAQGLRMPSVAPGNYFVSVRGIGWGQNFPVHF